MNTAAWWQQSWFLGGMLAAILALVVALVKWIFARRAKEKNCKRQIAATLQRWLRASLIACLTGDFRQIECVPSLVIDTEKVADLPSRLALQLSELTVRLENYKSVLRDVSAFKDDENVRHLADIDFYHVCNFANELYRALAREIGWSMEDALTTDDLATLQWLIKKAGSKLK